MPAPSAGLDRGAVLRKIEETQHARRDWLKRQIIDNDRIDLLATEILGYDVRPHHLRMIQHAVRYPDGNLLLGFRGSGKTTVRTISRAIHVLLKDPNKRVLIASKSSENSKAMLSEIKAHFAGQRLRDVFGQWVGDQWDEASVKVRPRTSPHKEPSIDTAGLESAVVSMHYDVILADDLVDEENARTSKMRDKTKTWFYKSLMPTLEPGGELHISGTRYHHQDLYGHLQGAEMAGGRTLILPALIGDDERGWKSAWPEKWPADKLLAMRKNYGLLIFESQYQCTTKLMVSGGVFDIDDFPVVPVGAVPAALPAFTGVDVAAGGPPKPGQDPDFFAQVAIKYDAATDRVYVLDHRRGRPSFPEQRRGSIEFAKLHKAAKSGLEINGYQKALFNEVRGADPDVVFVPLSTRVDKMTRALRLQGLAQQGQIVFVQGNDDVIAELVGFPEGHDDLFDALDHAIRVARMRRKKPRDEDPGLF